MLITVPPGVESGQVIQISAPARMVTERTVLSDASSATVGTWSTPPYSCCYGCCGGCYGCCGGPTEMVITESHQVQAIHYEQRSVCPTSQQLSNFAAARSVSLYYEQRYNCAAAKLDML